MQCWVRVQTRVKSQTWVTSSPLKNILYYVILYYIIMYYFILFYVIVRAMSLPP